MEAINLVELAWQAAHPHITPEDFLHPWDLNPSVIGLFARIMKKSSGSTLIVHSDVRDPQEGVSSYHTSGQAVDFRLRNYDPTHRKSLLQSYYDDWLHLTDVLSETGDMEIVGLGLYPNQNNPFFHLDTRGRKARWSRLVSSGPSDRSLDDGLAWLRRSIQRIDLSEVLLQTLDVPWMDDPMFTFHLVDDGEGQSISPLGAPDREGQHETCQHQ